MKPAQGPAGRRQPVCVGGVGHGYRTGKAMFGSPRSPSELCVLTEQPCGTAAPHVPQDLWLAGPSSLPAVTPRGFGSPGTTLTEELLFLCSCSPGICRAAVSHALFHKAAFPGQEPWLCRWGLGASVARGVSLNARAAEEPLKGWVGVFGVFSGVQLCPWKPPVPQGQLQPLSWSRALAAGVRSTRGTQPLADAGPCPRSGCLL